MTYRAAVIGSGRIGLALELDPKRPKPATHAGAWMQHPKTELVALCDSNPAFETVAGKLAPDAVCYSDAQAMLSAERPEIVSIATHQDSHVELARLAIASGAKAVLCEKPISDNLVAARALIDEANDAGVHLIVNHARRFDPLLRRLADELSSGLIGDLLQVTGYYVYGLVSTGTHLIDLLRMTLGPREGDVTWVAAWPNEHGVHYPEGDPCIDGVLGFESGLKVFIQSLDMRSYDHFEVRYFGRDGAAVCNGLTRRVDLFTAGEAATRAGFSELPHAPSDSWSNPDCSYFELAAENVVDCIEGRTQPLSTGRDSVAALAILQAMLESSEAEGRRIILPSEDAAGPPQLPAQVIASARNRIR